MFSSCSCWNFSSDSWYDLRRPLTLTFNSCPPTGLLVIWDQCHTSFHVLPALVSLAQTISWYQTSSGAVQWEMCKLSDDVSCCCLVLVLVLLALDVGCQVLSGDIVLLIPFYCIGLFYKLSILRSALQINCIHFNIMSTLVDWKPHTDGLFEN